MRSNAIHIKNTVRNLQEKPLEEQVAWCEGTISRALSRMKDSKAKSDASIALGWLSGMAALWVDYVEWKANSGQEDVE